MAMTFQAIYDQLVSLDRSIRSIALAPVADLEVKMGTGDWLNCLYGVMAQAVASHRGENFGPTDSTAWQAAKLLMLPAGQVNSGITAWDRSTVKERLQLRQAVKQFLDQEAKKTLIQEIEAMGDPLAVKPVKPKKDLPRTRTKVLVG